MQGARRRRVSLDTQAFEQRSRCGFFSKLGDVAQLVEHLLCKQGVTGSIPVISTILVEADRIFKSCVNLLGSEGFMELLLC